MDDFGVNLWTALAGLGLFLYGMHMLEDALRQLAGRSFKRFLHRHTGHPVKAVAAGALVTGILQSSSMVALLVMSFAGAGIIGLNNGIGMILGANLGTTVTGWLVSLIGFKLDIARMTLPLIAIGGLGLIFLRSRRLANFSKALMGFSFMFMGLGLMKDGADSYADVIDVSVLAGRHFLLFFAFGLVLSASIQSSSAAMMIYLAALAAGIITLPQAAYLVIGSDVGTTVTALIGTIGSNSIRKKVGFAQVTFNAISAVLALLMVPLYLQILTGLLDIKDPLITLVLFHSLFNLVAIAVVLPFLGPFTKLVNRLVLDQEKPHSHYLQLANPRESHAAVQALHKEAFQFVSQALRVNDSFFPSSREAPRSRSSNPYFDLKKYEAEIVDFYVPLQQSQLTAQEVEEVNRLIDAVRNATISAKELKDVTHNLESLYQSVRDDHFAFYRKIRDDQKKLYTRAQEMLDNSEQVASNDLLNLNQLVADFYRKETVKVFDTFALLRQTEPDVPTLLNLIRGINNSNEALIRSLHSMWA